MFPHVQDGPMVTGFPYCPDRKIQGLLRAHSAATGVQFESCLDVGCGRTRADTWFATTDLATGPRRYVGLELDPEIRAELLARGVDARDPGAPDVRDLRADLCTALEVIEHIDAVDTPAFLRTYLGKTNRLFALTTPNCEYWDGRKPAPGQERLRWIPDHFLDLTTLTHGDDSAHSHKQAFTPASLAAALAEALPDPSWRFTVYRGWPWTLTDQTAPRSYVLYYKLFALAWPTRPGS